MPRLHVVFLAVCIAFGLSASPLAAFAAEPPLRVAVSGPYPPFAEIDEAGQVYGFDVDIARALCAELGRDCEVVNYDFDAIIPAIVSGELDFAVAGMGASEERLQFVDFTDRYYRSASIFIERLGTVPEISPEALKGLRIGAQESSLQAEYLAMTYGDSITVVTNPSYDALYAMLKNSEVDLVFSDGLPGYTYLMSPEGEGLETIGEAIEPGGQRDWACVAVSKAQPELRAAINEAIQSLRRSGEYDKINREYFDFNVY